MNRIKSISLVVVAVSFASAIFAFSYKPNQQPQTLTFNLTLDQANVVLKALSKLPYDEASPVISLMQEQASAQLKPKAPVVQQKIDSSKAKSKKP